MTGVNSERAMLVNSWKALEWRFGHFQEAARITMPPEYLPPCSNPPPPWGGTVTWPKKHRKY